MYECILPGSIRYDTGLTICNTIRHKAREISSVQRKPQHGQYYDSKWKSVSCHCFNVIGVLENRSMRLKLTVSVNVYQKGVLINGVYVDKVVIRECLLIRTNTN